MDDLQTVVTEIEAVLNDRPLTYVSSDFNDEEPLTPSHLLYGRRITTTPYPRQNIEENNMHFDKKDICKYAKLQKHLTEQFFSRWKTEYLTSLREFHTQTGDNEEKVKIGQLVQIHEDKYPRNKWTVGVIVSLITGLTRAVVVRTKNRHTSRPIVKLYPLEISDSVQTGNITNRKLEPNRGDYRFVKQQCMLKRTFVNGRNREFILWTLIVDKVQMLS